MILLPQSLLSLSDFTLSITATRLPPCGLTSSPFDSRAIPLYLLHSFEATQRADKAASRRGAGENKGVRNLFCVDEVSKELLIINFAMAQPYMMMPSFTLSASCDFVAQVQEQEPGPPRQEARELLLQGIDPCKKRK